MSDIPLTGAARMLIEMHRMFAFTDLDEPRDLENLIAEIEATEMPFAVELGDEVRRLVMEERETD